MKLKLLAPFVAISILFTTGCDKKTEDSAVAKRLAELERKADEALERNRQLEQENQEQKLAAERDAIERERMQIEEDRLKLEQQQTAADAAEADALRQREQALAAREGKAEQLQSSLEEKDNDLQQRGEELSERDRDLAGREAIAIENTNVQSVPVGDYGMFYDSLSSYGSWFETPDYGYVWQPVIVRDSGWRPYTRGRWACSDHGWTWMSDEPFGWATYHYGRWCLLRGRGWIWVPGSEWAPSWVSWRSSSSHIGWAPLPPETLAYRGRRWDSNVDVTFGIGSLWFNFVETRNFGRPIHRHCLPYARNNTYVQQTVNITNIYVQNNRVICGGPKYNDIRRETGGAVPFYRLDMDRHDRPGRNAYDMKHQVHGDRLRVAAPDMDVAWNEGLKPSHVKGRLENITVERPEALRPEIADEFRKNREEHRARADQSIAKMGGKEQFNRQRTEQFETNRRQLEAQDRVTTAARETKEKNMRDKGGKPNGSRPDSRDPLERSKPERHSGQEETAGKGKESETHHQNDRPDLAKQQQDAQNKQERLNQDAKRLQDEMRKKNDKINVLPKVADRPTRENEDALRSQQLEGAKQQQQENARREQMERAKQQQQNAQREQQENSRREQMERAKQQQQNAQREQQENSRREQMERAKQQQQNAQREQQENSRREQMERAKQQQQDVQRQQQERSKKSETEEEKSRSKQGR